MDNKVKAALFVADLINKCDVGGEHYSPDFRDHLHDEQEWLIARVQALLDADTKLG